MYSKKYWFTAFLISCVLLLVFVSSGFRWHGPEAAEATAASVEIRAIQHVESALTHISSSPSSGQFLPNATQKYVIAFSLYGTHEKYLNGALQNVDLAKLYYPGWKCRFYVGSNSDVPAALLAQLQLKGAEVQRMEADAVITPTSCGILRAEEGVRHVAADKASMGPDSAAYPLTGSALGMFWRLCVALDPAVDVYVIRDVDSRINSREVMAVSEWLMPQQSPYSQAGGAHAKRSAPPSGKLVHLMRDHPTHCSFAVMGGMWGAKRNAGIGSLIQQTLASFVQAKGGGGGAAVVWGTDQEYLRQHMWPVVRSRDLHLSHDSHCCESFNDTYPFPAPRLRAQHVGQIYNAKHETKFDVNALQPVPPRCRKHPGDIYG
jgi:hypothetical protein